MQQLTLSLGPRPAGIADGKKLSRIPIACSDDLKGFVESMAKAQGVSVSEMCHRYIIQGLQNDLGAVFLQEPHLDKRLRDLMVRS
jgi:hypothetical protein